MFAYLIFLLAYLLGALPSAFLAGKIKNIDVRKHGSGNMGATNTFRVLGPLWGIGVLAADALKGGLAAYLCWLVFGPWGGIAGGLLAMLGHSFNPYFGFKRTGKGAACGLGVIVVLVPKVTIVALVVFILVVLVSRYVSLGSILAAVTVIIMAFVFQEPLEYKVLALVGASTVIFLHQSNIKRILNGTEAKFGKNKGE
ncbi:glycerol-3-phosphate 1-O-acyltransferase PlsY [Dehalobacter sp. TeCB1]|jgi:glycerol-3-phosphate acyltransferase PlsY|uniref:glycerol-3-phosphate 1-O-acyltransferase PlsY n=1 Tax=Dehalobacter sp. TeCB1 TaxID=1843715 RepID=UPI00083B4068|nr:glycerol-3-phosphate 1-O-acyltransferase PlsY [Dehalobacter sp. TeCB1]OCZ49530.1 acyl-phosphate glycerol 3-phosphate acyltransferase [Dehalobacter sp. TeCB1]